MISILVGNLINLGDALIAQHESVYLQSKGHEVVVLPYEKVSMELRKEFSSLGIKIISIRENPFYSLLTCLKSHIIFGGGHMIREHVSLPWLLFCVSLSFFNRIFGRSFIIAGVGATLITSFVRNFLYGLIIKNASSVYARDDESLNIINGMAKTCRNKIKLGSDMAYLVKFGNFNYQNGICLISPAVDALENRNTQVEEIICILYKFNEVGLKKIILVPHDLRCDFDVLACIEMRVELIKHFSVEINISDACVVSDLICLYKSATWVITARLHGLILSSMLKKSVYYTNQSTKKLKVFADIFNYCELGNFACGVVDLDFDDLLLKLKSDAESTFSNEDFSKN